MPKRTSDILVPPQQLILAPATCVSKRLGGDEVGIIRFFDVFESPLNPRRFAAHLDETISR